MWEGISTLGLLFDAVTDLMFPMAEAMDALRYISLTDPLACP